MLRDGLNEPAWKGAEALVAGSTNAAERAQAALLGARAALGRGAWQDGLRPSGPLAATRSPGPAWVRRPSSGRRGCSWPRAFPPRPPVSSPGWTPWTRPMSYRVPLLRLKARCLLALERRDDALAFLAMASAASAPGPASAEAMLDQAILLIRSGREDEAAPLLAELSTSGWSTPASAEARVWLGRLLAARPNTTPAAGKSSRWPPVPTRSPGCAPRRTRCSPPCTKARATFLPRCARPKAWSPFSPTPPTP
jgi:hypothetical protein